MTGHRAAHAYRKFRSIRHLAVFALPSVVCAQVLSLRDGLVGIIVWFYWVFRLFGWFKQRHCIKSLIKNRTIAHAAHDAVFVITVPRDR